MAYAISRKKAKKLTAPETFTFTSSTQTVDRGLHAGQTLVLDRAAGVAITLPAATGSGAEYKFYVKTTVTSNTSVIKVANATDTFVGMAFCNSDNASDAAISYTASGTDDTMTMDGSTRGGIAGDFIRVTDIASGKYSIQALITTTGTEATPFSATVS